MQGATCVSCKVAVITNAKSGKNKRGGYEKFEQLISQYPTIRHYVVFHVDEVISALESCKKNNIKIIIVNGGDGTLQLVLTFLCSNNKQSYDPKILLLRAGTTSMSYGDVGCSASHKSILSRLVEYSQTDVLRFNEVKRPSICMRLSNESNPICGMFFGAGAIHSGILYCRQNIHTKGMRGEIGPSLAMIRYLFDWVTVGKLVKPVKATFYLDNSEQVDGVFSVIVATSLQRLLIGAFPFWANKPPDNHFKLTMIKKNAPKPLRAFMKILRGRAPKVKNSKDFYYSISPPQVKISLDGGFTLDGELFGEEGVHTEIELSVTRLVTFLV